jgi:hypothetical protein
VRPRRSITSNLPDARTRSNGAGVVREKDPVSWLLFLAAFSDEGGSARALAEAGVLTVADAAISNAEAWLNHRRLFYDQIPPQIGAQILIRSPRAK